MKTNETKTNSRYNTVKICEHCKNEFKVEAYRASVARFCSRKCSFDGCKKPIEERFWSKVDKTGGQNACWPWNGRKSKTGQGNFYGHSKLRVIKSSQFAFESVNGPVKNGLWVLHKCDNPNCCNPDHLFLGTAKDNTCDMISKGRKAVYIRQDILNAHEAVAAIAALEIEDGKNRIAEMKTALAALHKLKESL